MPFIQFLILGALLIFMPPPTAYGMETPYRIIKVEKLPNPEDITQEPVTYYQIDAGKIHGMKAGDLFKIYRVINEKVEHTLYIGKVQIIESYENVCLTQLYDMAETKAFPASEYHTVMLGDLATPWAPKKDVVAVKKSPPKAKDKRVVETVKVSHMVLFDLDKSVLRPGGKKLLSELAKKIREFQGTIQVEGHTCDLGSNKYNKNLSKKRAKAVVKYLLSEEKISKEKLEAKWFGETKRLSKKKTDQARALNRRVEFKFLEE